MAKQIIECVPNISEGRDLERIDAIVASAKNISGCKVLGVEPDADYNRTVITIAGEPMAVKNAAYNIIEAAIELIDMSKHTGEHPRLGAVDVCPFIPLQNYTMEQCNDIANDLAKSIAQDYGVPTFLYGYAATSPERTLLSSLRKGEYESLENRINDKKIHSPTQKPDYGPNNWTKQAEKSGGITIGTRDILVAYNVNIDEHDARVSKYIGSLIRGSGRLIKRGESKKLRVRGMIKEVQGMGVVLESHGISQVSMNILDINNCPLHVPYEICRSIASDHGIDLKGSELVGLIPLNAMLEAGRWFSEDNENDEKKLVANAIDGLGLSELNQFNPNERIIEWALLEAL